MDAEKKFKPFEYKPGGGFVHPELRIIQDSINVWSVIGTLAANPEDEETLIDVTSQDLPTYENYVREHYPAPGGAEALIKETDPGKIAAFNELVNEFNSKRGQISNEKDINAIRDFWNKANLLIRGK